MIIVVPATARYIIHEKEIIKTGLAQLTSCTGHFYEHPLSHWTLSLKNSILDCTLAVVG